MTAVQTWRTVRHLRPGQIWARAWRKLRHLCTDFDGFSRQQAPPGPNPAAPYRRELPDAAPEGNSMQQIQGGRFCFLNQTRHVGFPPDWSAAGADRLWSYNLHYFETLWLLDYASCRRLVLDWIVNHRLSDSAVGWEPYPTSLRLVNWLGVLLGRFRNVTLADAEFIQPLWQSLFIQGQWLSRQVETHLRGNHLFENAAALSLLGRSFTGHAAAEWWKQGSSLLQSQISEQILTDGVHFERSPMYQSRILWVLLALSAAGCGSLDSRIHAAAVSLAGGLARMCHPDGQIALLNDAAMGVYPAPSALLAEAGRLGLGDLPECRTGPFALPQAGYYGWRNDRGDYLICDAGPIGPDYMPGHAHGDIFSFELSLAGHRVIVDSGVHDYQVGPMRDYCRSTAAHNTVEIDRADQCEFWQAFRVARRGRPRKVRYGPQGDGFALAGWHDGYRRLPGRPVHERSLQFQDQGVLLVRDRVRSASPVAWVSRLHLHPDCRVISTSRRTVRLATPAGTCCLQFQGPGELRVKASQYCPRFGQVLENRAIEFRTAGTDTETAFCLTTSRQRQVSAGETNLNQKAA